MEHFTFILDSSKKEPLYLQLYRYVKEEIRLGRIPSGEKLPSKRNAGGALNISVNTVESAYEQLEAEGYIEARDRSGFYVCAIEDTMELLPGVPPQAESPSGAEKPVSGQIRFSFDTANVDTHFFPYATWSRLSKNLMYQHREYLELGDSKGDLSLRRTLCSFLHQTRGVNCTPEQVLVGAGSEYLLGILASLLGTDLNYAMENPCYNKTYHILRRAGARVSLIPLDAGGISLTELERANAQVVHITPSHQFPMGTIMPVSRRIQLLNWASHGRYIIEDDYDSEFRYAGRPIPALQGMDTQGRVIYLTTFSKSISPSFRLSVLILPQDLVQRYDQMFRFYSSTVSRYEQHTLEQFITGGHFERHLNKLRKIYKGRKECLEHGLKQIPGGRIIGANAGLHFVFHLPGREEAELIRLAKKAGVAVTGLSQCYPMDQKGCLSGAVLMGYATLNETEIQTAVGLLKTAWQ